MNAKKAKALRALTRRLTSMGSIEKPSLEYCTLGENKTTQVVNPGCEKGVYKRMKKFGPGLVLAGKA